MTRTISMSLNGHEEWGSPDATRITISGIGLNGEEIVETVVVSKDGGPVGTQSKFISIGPGRNVDAWVRATGRRPWAIMRALEEYDSRKRRGLRAETQWRRLWGRLPPAIVRIDAPTALIGAIRSCVQQEAARLIEESRRPLMQYYAAASAADCIPLAVDNGLPTNTVRFVWSDGREELKRLDEAQAPRRTEDE